jgi:GNAT superfamily N-acetyltransferase
MVDQPQIDAASLAGITCPTTVMVGELDTILPEETHRIAASVPDARLVVVSGADHTLPKVAADAVTRELLGTVALNDVRHVPGSLDASCAPADVTVVPLPREERWARALDALYEHVDARPGTSGWTAGVWPPVGLARELLADGSYWGAFDAADVAGGTPGPEATLLGAFAVDHDADMGDGSLPGAGSGLGDPDWATLPEHDVASYHLLAVDPAARGRRVAVALLAAGERAARGLGARVVRINTSPVNVEACGLYERWGFTRHRPVWLPYEGLDLPGWTSLWEQEL